MKSILLVEDDPFVIDIYTKKLKAAGFSVEVVQDGEGTLRRLKETKPDLLVLDIVLPDIDGWELLSKIRENEKLKDLKVVVLSNLGQKNDVDKGQEFGVLRYFIKAHYTPTQVVKAIKEILK